MLLYLALIVPESKYHILPSNLIALTSKTSDALG